MRQARLALRVIGASDRLEREPDGSVLSAMLHHDEDGDR
jgi:hypothetical protein